MLLCLSNAFTRANSFLLLRSEMRTWAWFRTACCRTDKGPWLISCSSNWRNWASSSSDFGTWTYWLYEIEMISLENVQSMGTTYLMLGVELETLQPNWDRKSLSWTVAELTAHLPLHPPSTWDVSEQRERQGQPRHMWLVLLPSKGCNVRSQIFAGYVSWKVRS